jgi:hypothetical protein
MSKKHTIEDCRALAEVRGGKCLSSEYKDNKTLIEWQCNKGHKWPASFHNILDGNTWCPECANSIRNTNKKCGIADCVEIAKRKGGVFLSKTYTKTEDLYEWACAKGHIWQASHNNIKFRSWCPVCAISNRIDTVKRKYGVDNVLKNEKVKQKLKETVQNKYGVDNIMKNPEIAKKNVLSLCKSITLKHWLTNSDLVCVGSYEIAVVNYFNANQINFHWQHETFTMPDGRTYRPDAYLMNENKWIEIKGYFRKDAEEKWDWFHSQHKNSELWTEEVLKQKGIL